MNKKKKKSLFDHRGVRCRVVEMFDGRFRKLGFHHKAPKKNHHLQLVYFVQTIFWSWHSNDYFMAHGQISFC